MVNKFDENLNSSLSYISEFDLEEDEKGMNSSFNSLDNDISVEESDILIKKRIRKKILLDSDDEKKHNKKLEKEWKDIQELLLKK